LDCRKFDYLYKIGCRRAFFRKLEMKLCECGCGKEIKENRRFVYGHNWRGKIRGKRSLESRRKQSESMKGKNKGRISPLKGKKRSLESRKKQSESKKGKLSPMKGRKHSLESRKRISEKLKGRKRSLESRKKQSESRKGKKQSEETIRKRAEKNRGRKRSLETRKRISEELKGKKRSLESRKKQSESRKGMIFTEEHKRNLSESRKGIIFTEEHRKNLSIAANNAIDPRYKSGYFYSNKMQKEIFYQSSLELKALEIFEKDKNIWSIERYNLGSIKYKMNGSYHSYNPDYILNKKIVYEIKPEWQLKDKKNLAKIKAGKKYCKEKNLEFRVLTEKDLKQEHRK